MIELEVKLPDSPGSLIELISPIANNGGNIYGILHHHDKKLGNMIPVTITFDLTEELLQPGLEKIRDQLKKKKIEVDKITMGDKKTYLVVILSGHVFDTDILDTIDRLAAKKIKVLDLQAKFTEMSEISNVKFKFEINEQKTEQEIIKEIEKICREKDLFLIRT